MFTENQVRQFYVVPTGSADNTNVKEPVKVDGNASPAVKAADLSNLATGACQFVINNAGDEAYMLYKGPSTDGFQRSDLIKKCNVIDVRFTDATDMIHPMRKLEIALDSNVSSSPVVGQEYILNVEIKNYIALGYNSTKVKFGVAKAVTGDAASDLYKKLAINLAKNFAREPWPLVKIMVKISSSYVEVLPSYTTSSSALSGSASCIAIEEVEQPWRLGAAKQEFVDFSVYPSTINTGSAEGVWGTVTDATPAKESATVGTNAFSNSKAVADMEYFFHKERGDVYGYAGFPYNVDTTYQVVPTLAAGYSMVDIHYYFEGNSHNVGHSEKTLTVVGSKANLNRLFGHAASTSGGTTTPANGLYAFLDGTGVEIKKSASWG
jgi:hypothetical protein